jgi:hypothetical protein
MMLRKLSLPVFLCLFAIPLFAATAPAGDDSARPVSFPHASRFQQHQLIPVTVIHALCADCDEQPPIDDGLTPGGMPTFGCNDLHVCSQKYGCYFAVYAHCFLGPDSHPDWGIWSPCMSC